MDIKEQVASLIRPYLYDEELKADEVADQIIPLVRADMQRVAANRVKALEDLLVCYRIGKHPAEGLHTRLDKSGKDWQALKSGTFKEGE